MGSSSAAKKAWATRRGKKKPVTTKARAPKKSQKHKSSKKGKKKSKGKGMPKNVVQYFKFLNQGMSKAEARKKAGLPPAKPKKEWGPGHPLYEWQQKQKK